MIISEAESAVFTLLLHILLPGDNITRLFISTVAGVDCVCGGRKMSPRTSSFMQSLYVLSFRDYLLMRSGVSENCIPVKPMLGGVDSVAPFIAVICNPNETEAAVFTLLLHVCFLEIIRSQYRCYALNLKEFSHEGVSPSEQITNI